MLGRLKTLKQQLKTTKTKQQKQKIQKRNVHGNELLGMQLDFERLVKAKFDWGK